MYTLEATSKELLIGNTKVLSTLQYLKPRTNLANLANICKRPVLTFAVNGLIRISSSSILYTAKAINF